VALVINKSLSVALWFIERRRDPPGPIDLDGIGVGLRFRSVGGSQMKAQIRMFLVITFALTIVCCYPLIRAGDMYLAGGVYVMGIMWSPGIAALVTCLVYQRNLRGLGWGLGRVSYLLAGYLIPLGAALIVYSTVWVTGLGEFRVTEYFGINTAGTFGVENPGFGVSLAIMLTGGLFLRMILALGEEIGWRGFLVPRLATVVSLKRAAILSGVIWAIYHLPGLLLLQYHSGSRPRSVVCFTIMAIAASVIMAWLRMRSGSLWTAAVFHSSHNLAIQGIFNGLTEKTGATEFFIDEFGIGMAMVYTVAAIWFWRRFRSIGEPVAEPVN